MAGADALAAGFARAGVSVLAVERSEPLTASPFATADLPERVDVAIIADTSEGPVELLALSGVPLAAASVLLGDYRLDLDDRAGRVVLFEPAFQRATTIWSDGRFQSGEEAEARFWGTVSLQLAGGGFITAATKARDDNPNAFVLDVLTVTKGEAALVVRGVGEGAGDMTLATSLGGWKIEERTRDGLVLVDGKDGADWHQEAGRRPVDAAYLAQTAPGALFGPGSGTWSGREFGRVVAAFNRLITTQFNCLDLSRSSSVVIDTVRDSQSRSSDRDAVERHRAVIQATERAALLRSALLTD